MDCSKDLVIADDQTRYFIFASAVFDVVLPVFRGKLEDYYRGLGIQDLPAFLNHQPIAHMMFHLRFRNGHRCCFDATNCFSKSYFPLIKPQWNLLYTNSTNPKCSRLCHCNYTANLVCLHDLNLNLISIILTDVCKLPYTDETNIKNLRTFKNIYLSHNKEGCISKDDFDTLWVDLTTYILQLDITKQDDLIRIEKRPMDGSDDQMCIHQTLQKLGEKVDKALGWKILDREFDMKINGSRFNKAEDDRKRYFLFGSAMFKMEEKLDNHIVKKYIQAYNVRSDPRGICLIINNIHFKDKLKYYREGAEQDSLKMKTLFDSIGFKVDVMEDLTAQEMFTTLNELSRSEQLYSVDSLVVVLMSHGNNEMIDGTDCQNITVIDLVKLFNADNCPGMMSKPKMFIINACRGGDGDYEKSPTSITFGGSLPTNDLTEMDAKGSFCRGQPANSDIVIAYSTFPGYVSFRDLAIGSWFIQKFVEVFSELADNEHVLDMLTQVNNRVAEMSERELGYNQTPAPTSTLRKKWYMNPPSRD